MSQLVCQCQYGLQILIFKAMKADKDKKILKEYLAHLQSKYIIISMEFLLLLSYYCQFYGPPCNCQLFFTTRLQFLMKQAKGNLQQQIKQSKKHLSTKQTSIDFYKIIQKQREVIQSLQEELILLKSYISLQTFHQDEIISSKISIESTECLSEASKDIQDRRLSLMKDYENILREVMNILQIKKCEKIDEYQIVGSLRALKQASSRKNQPIFVERIKEIKVPITVQKIVEKIVQKIVYQQKPVPTQRTQQKFEPYRPLDKTTKKNTFQNQQDRCLNKTYSQKILQRQTTSNYREDNYQPKYQNDNKKYESNVVKRRRQVNSKAYWYKNDGN